MIERMLRCARLSLWTLMIYLIASARAQPLPDAQSLLDRMKARMDQVYSDSKTNHFHYMRTNLLEELDGQGHVKKQEVKTYEVVLVQGLPRARLVAKDGRALSESEQKWHRAEEQKLQRTVAQEKTPDWNKPKPWLNDDLLARFTFTVVARTNFDNRPAIVMKFAPRPDAPMRSLVDRIINRISGAFIVDEQEAEIASLHLVINEPIKFWGGILGELDRFDCTLQRKRSPAGVWFNHLTTGLVQIRKLLATSRFRFNEEAFNFSGAE